MRVFLISLLALVTIIFSCNRETPGVEAAYKYHKHVILLDEFGLESCNYEGINGEDLVFTYHYKGPDTSRTMQSLYELLTTRDSTFDTFYVAYNEIYLKKYTGSGADSLASWRQYKILHKGTPTRTVTVLYRDTKNGLDSTENQLWLDRLDACHNQ
ncbi:MAG: hypothetical protein KDC92_10820 [Bacteroidetes bacterium]|nr:hypothetical protein [Bacteroidota bacterium]